MQKRKKILLFILIVFIGMQFFPSHKNRSGAPATKDVATIFNIPDSVLITLKQSCYDCHSNNTNYPWYSNIQPFGWWLNGHITEGKEELNFNEFGNYAGKRRINKLNAIANSVKDETMPLQSYLIIHPNARLSSHGKLAILNWINKTNDSLTKK